MHLWLNSIIYYTDLTIILLLYASVPLTLRKIYFLTYNKTLLLAKSAFTSVY